MNVLGLLRRSEAVVGLAHDARRLARIPRRIALLRHRRRAIEEYLAAHRVRKLHLGAGPVRLAGWLDTDLEPSSGGAVLLDARRPFPLPDASFDYAFSEHMIEHVTWAEGLFLLGECRRVLKPGGTVRIATPDLEVFLRLHGNEEEPRNGRYVHWVTDRYLAEPHAYQAAFVINNLFRAWGHVFLYDGRSLALALSGAGFVRARRVAAGESADPHLRGIESHGRVVQDEEMAAFETMVFEADRLE